MEQYTVFCVENASQTRQHSLTSFAFRLALLSITQMLQMGKHQQVIVVNLFWLHVHTVKSNRYKHDLNLSLFRMFLLGCLNAELKPAHAYQYLTYEKYAILIHEYIPSHIGCGVA